MTTRPVVVVGDVMVDIVACLAGPITRGSDTAAEVHIGGGGSAANVAAWLADCGTEVALVGRIGDDAYGEAQVASLQAAGVQPALARDPERPTGTCIVVVEPDGERTMLPDRGANLWLRSEDLPGSLLRRGAHLHLSAYTLFDPRPRAAALDMLGRARAAGMTVSVDPSSVAPLRAVGAEEFLAWTAGADVVVPNVDEAEVLTGRRDVRAAALALTRHYPSVVITAGRDGAVYAEGDRVIAVPAVAAPVVDTTGAGDAFTAGFLSTWLTTTDPEPALIAGATLAARAVATVGARPR